jgi:hypothetical protein
LIGTVPCAVDNTTAQGTVRTYRFLTRPQLKLE